jgi:hypothetical protein
MENEFTNKGCNFIQEKQILTQVPKPATWLSFRDLVQVKLKHSIKIKKPTI